MLTLPTVASASAPPPSASVTNTICHDGFVIHDFPLTNFKTGESAQRLNILALALLSTFTTFYAAQLSAAFAFEGRINALLIQGNETNVLLYTGRTNFLRIEMT